MQTAEVILFFFFFKRTKQTQRSKLTDLSSSIRGIKFIFIGGHISLTVAFKGLNVILGLYKCSYSLTRGKELCTAAQKQGAGPGKTRWRAGFGLLALCLPPVSQSGQAYMPMLFILHCTIFVITLKFQYILAQGRIMMKSLIKIY